MKYIFVLLISCLSVVGQTTIFTNGGITIFQSGQTTRFTNAPSSNNDITSGEVQALWLDNNYTDSSVNGNNGSGVGTPTFVTGFDGIATHAVSLNGSSQYVNGGSVGNFTTPPFTICGWFKCNSANLSGVPVLMYKGAYGVNGYYVQISSIGQIQFYVNVNGTPPVCTTGGAVFTVGTTNFIVCTLAGTTASIYTNGVLAASLTDVNYPVIPSSSDAYQIGSYNLGTIYANIVADDCRIYNRALSAGEAATLYSNGPK